MKILQLKRGHVVIGEETRGGGAVAGYLDNIVQGHEHALGKAHVFDGGDDETLFNLKEAVAGQGGEEPLAGVDRVHVVKAGDQEGFIGLADDLG